MVTPETIATALGRPTPDESSPQLAQWSMWIADANRAIQRRAERLSIDVGTLDADDIDYVVREAVVAHVRRPDDATQVTKTLDDGTISRTYPVGAGRVEILPDQWDLLGLALPTEAFSIMTYGEPSPPPVVWP